ncbi:unnamed protein product [Closterium sp. NIES-53]
MQGLRQALPLLGLDSGARLRPGDSGASGGSSGFSGGTTEEHVCWTSSGEYESPSGVIIHGSGCSACLRGQRCSFLVSIRPPAHWIAPEQADKGSKHTWWQRDLSLLLRGPALAHGDVRCLDPPSCTELSVSYRVWDIGEYWATLNVGCANLNFSAASLHHLHSTQQNTLTSWPITIHPRFRPNSPSLPTEPLHRASDSPNLGPRLGSSPLRTSLLESPPAGFPRSLEEDRKLPESPCAAVSVPGRWVKDEGGEGYRWSFFPCSPKELPPSQWISALDRRGIREISIVGDSHQRFLTAHLFFLLTGEDMNEIEKGRTVNETRVYIARDEMNRTLKINFYWIAGVYEDWENGCSHPRTLNRTGPFPTISPTADVTLFEAGYWAAVFCREPLKALHTHLQKFLRWAVSTATPGKGRVVFRTIPSFPLRGDWCNSWHPGPSSNRAGMAINALMKHLVRGMDGNEEQGGREGQEADACEADLDCSLQQLPEEKGEEPGGEGGGLPASATASEPPASSSAAAAAAAAPSAKPAGAATQPSILDLWMVDGPRYTDTGRPFDHHYSALVHAGPGKGQPLVVKGDVGEAHARALMHYLLHVMR